jgi:tetratricopeptide (TPR) repeat protein
MKYRALLILLVFCCGTLSAADDLAGSMLASGRVDEAISTLKQQISTQPSKAEAYNLLCRSYLSLGNWDAGIAACEKAVSLEPGNSRYHLWLGRIYGEKADDANFFSAASLAGKVRREFEQAVKLDPDNAETRTDLAEFYLEAPGIVGGGQDKARAEAEVLAKLDPARAHWVNGRIAEKRKDATTAEREYRAAIEVSHGDANAWLNLALFFRHEHRLDEMEDALKHAAAAEKIEPEVLVDAAETLQRANRNFDEAVRLLRRYLALDAKTETAPAFKAHYVLGTLLEKQGDKQAARQEYQAALSLASGYTRAQEALNRLNR